jgi:hypothetical protein
MPEEWVLRGSGLTMLAPGETASTRGRGRRSSGRGRPSEDDAADAATREEDEVARKAQFQAFRAEVRQFGGAGLDRKKDKRSFQEQELARLRVALPSKARMGALVVCCWPRDDHLPLTLPALPAVDAAGSFGR